MATKLSVDEYQLLDFFAAAPKSVDHDISWLYNNSVYEASGGDVHFSFALIPASKDVRITLEIHGATVYELNATAVEDVRHHAEKGREALEVVLTRQDSIWIYLRPAIAIRQQVAGQF
jgi:hypothetical protein